MAPSLSPRGKVHRPMYTRPRRLRGPRLPRPACRAMPGRTWQEHSSRGAIPAAHSHRRGSEQSWITSVVRPRRPDSPVTTCLASSDAVTLRVLGPPVLLHHMDGWSPCHGTGGLSVRGGPRESCQVRGAEISRHPRMPPTPCPRCPRPSVDDSACSPLLPGDTCRPPPHSSTLLPAAVLGRSWYP